MKKAISIFILTWFLILFVQIQVDLYKLHKMELQTLKNEWGSCPILRDGWIIECNNDVHREEFRYRMYSCKNDVTPLRGNLECFIRTLPDLFK